MKPSDDDSAAIVCARRIADSTNGSITAVTIGKVVESWSYPAGGFGVSFRKS